MATLTLGNSYGVSTEIKILNNSSSSLKIIIFDLDTDKKEEFEIETGQYHEIIYSGMNTPKPPLNYIRKIAIYNGDNVLIKGFLQILFRFENGTFVEAKDPEAEGFFILEDNIFQFVGEEWKGGFFSRSKYGRTHYYLLEITDELLE
jgi:hypothetical protein